MNSREKMKKLKFLIRSKSMNYLPEVFSTGPNVTPISLLTVSRFVSHHVTIATSASESISTHVDW
jgi:hypothetical protein